MPAEPPAPVRVLYVEEQPRWEYRYVKNALLRVDPGIEAQCWLVDAAGKFEQEHSERLPTLTQLPRSYAEFAAYDVILVGDVPVASLGADDAERLEWIGRLHDFVRDGGGVGFMFGPRAMPEAYRGTPVEEMLPVVLRDRANDPDRRRQPRPEIRPIPVERDGEVHPIARLEPDPVVNRRLWHEALRPWTSVQPVASLAVDCELVLKSAAGGLPIAAVRDGKAGRVFVSTADDTWRMRNPFGEKYHDSFWRNVVRWLARREVPTPVEKERRRRVR